MGNPILETSYIPLFEGSISRCRKIHDHLVIFNREGTIVGARTNNPRLKEGANFYSFMNQSEAALVADLCNSFDFKWLIIDTDLGAAAICTSFYGVCRLLLAVIFISPKDSVCKYFSAAGLRKVYISSEIKKLANCKAKDNEGLLIDESFQKADGAFSCRSILEARYRAGANIGKFLAGRVLEIADFIGCVGNCKTLLDFIPRLDSFSPEIFIVTASCTTLFARNNSPSRSFEAKIDKYKDRLLLSFCVEVDEDFILYVGRNPADSLLRECESIANERDTYFDCSLLSGEQPRLILSCVPETDPMIGRRIKQDIKSHIQSFWE